MLFLPFFFFNKPTNSIDFQSPVLAHLAQMKPLTASKKRRAETPSLHGGGAKGWGADALFSPRQFTTRPVLSTAGSGNPGEEKTGGFPSSRQQTDARSEGEPARLRLSPPSAPSPIQVRNTREPRRASALGGCQDVSTC